MPLNLLYIMVQKSQKWPKTQIKGGPALNWINTTFCKLAPFPKFTKNGGAQNWNFTLHYKIPSLICLHSYGVGRWHNIALVGALVGNQGDSEGVGKWQPGT